MSSKPQPMRVLMTQLVPAPAIEAGSLLIRVHAAGLNPLDYKIRRGDLRLIRRLGFPQVMGQECAGVVDAVAPGPCAFAPGDDVFVRLDKDRMGGFAEYVCDRAENVALRPKSIAPEVAAGVPLVALTAWQCLRVAACLLLEPSVVLAAAVEFEQELERRPVRQLQAAVAVRRRDREIVVVQRSDLKAVFL